MTFDPTLPMITLFNKNNQLVPLKLWLDNPEELETEALKQALNLTLLPFAYHHIAIMPDAHQGYGMPIGGVLAADDAIIPYAVGLDIGCGMRSAETSIKVRDLSPEKINLILNQIGKAIPQGFDWHKKPKKHPIFDELPQEVGILREEAQNVRYQLGTLGGGNHFVELQRDPQGILWVMIHSGSRNIGKKVAEHFHKRAVKSCQAKGISLPTSELSFFGFDTPDGQEYFKAMSWCQKFSRTNREAMMEIILDILGETPRNIIDIHHNYAGIETHFGKEVIVHRKGAVKAEEGLPGVIPGSMGTHSYIVEGMGNLESFQSSAHGAGRRLGRNQARRTIPVERVFREMAEKNIVIATATKHELPEECDSAYKNIDAVMEYQKDLVKIVTTLYPIAVLKG
jgi:tRNA-splicing ligase RtcB